MKEVSFGGAYCVNDIQTNEHEQTTNGWSNNRGISLSRIFDFMSALFSLLVISPNCVLVDAIYFTIFRHLPISFCFRSHCWQAVRAYVVISRLLDLFNETTMNRMEFSLLARFDAIKYGNDCLTQNDSMKMCWHKIVPFFSRKKTKNFSIPFYCDEDECRLFWWCAAHFQCFQNGFLRLFNFVQLIFFISPNRIKSKSFCNLIELIVIKLNCHFYELFSSSYSSRVGLPSLVHSASLADPT